MGAVTFTPSTTDGTGRFPTAYIDNRRAQRGTIQFSSSYATGGDTLAFTNLELRQVTGLLVIPSTIATSAGLSLLLGGTSAAPTIIAVDADGTQVANATNLSARQLTTVYLLGH